MNKNNSKLEKRKIIARLEKLHKLYSYQYDDMIKAGELAGIAECIRQVKKMRA